MYIMEENKTKNAYILVDRNIKGILGVFTSYKFARCKQQSLIMKDLTMYLKELQLKVLHSNADVITLGKIQMIRYIFDDPSTKVFTLDVEYDNKSSSLNRYVIYTKELNHMPLQIPETQGIIIT
jgi:hypothetical protein